MTDPLADVRPLAERFAEALRDHARNCICDRWVTHHAQMLAVIAGRPIATKTYSLDDVAEEFGVDLTDEEMT